MQYTSITLISAPFHNGIYNHAVGTGPARILAAGLIAKLTIPIHQHEIARVDDFVDDIGRSFEVFRRISVLVTNAFRENSFPILLSGHCGGTIGVHAGASAHFQQDIGCIWFDAHDDFNTPETVTSGYFDGMPVAILAGECWKAMRESIPGHLPLKLERFVHVGLRDLNELERERIVRAGYPVIWGDHEKPEYVAELLKMKLSGLAVVHVDLDCLDASVGQVNKYSPTDGGLLADELVECLKMLAERVDPVALTVASYDAGYDGEGTIAKMAENVNAYAHP